MHVELPEFKRFCCCIPLRYGLLAWTYIRMLYLLPITISGTVTLYREVIGDYPIHYSSAQITLQIVILIWLLLDIAFNVVFLVGGHTKNIKLLKVQYYYNIVSLVLYTLLVSVLAFYLILMFYVIILIFHYGFTILIAYLCGFIIGIVMQVYILLLTRSEIRKLTNNTEFRFVNNAAEAQCSAIIADNPEYIGPYHKGVLLV